MTQIQQCPFTAVRADLNALKSERSQTPRIRLVSRRIVTGISKTFWIVAANLALLALTALIGVSLEQSYAVVLGSLLVSRRLTGLFWIGALAAAVIPFGFLAGHSCVAFAACLSEARKFGSDRIPTFAARR